MKKPANVLVMPASHTDHLTPEQLSYVLDAVAQLRPTGANVVGQYTIDLPLDRGHLTCALYGPAMGDAPIGAHLCTEVVRGDRKCASRILDGALPRPTQQCTVIVGPFEGAAHVLYTAYGGVPAPREPWDIDAEGEPEAFWESVAFWGVHALALEEQS